MCSAWSALRDALLNSSDPQKSTRSGFEVFFGTSSAGRKSTKVRRIILDMTLVLILTLLKLKCCMIQGLNATRDLFA